MIQDLHRAVLPACGTESDLPCRIFWVARGLGPDGRPSRATEQWARPEAETIVAEGRNQTPAVGTGLLIPCTPATPINSMFQSDRFVPHL